MIHNLDFDWRRDFVLVRTLFHILTSCKLFVLMLVNVVVYQCLVTVDCQDAYENEVENAEECVAPLLGEEHAQLYPLITKLVIASCQMTKQSE